MNIDHKLHTKVKGINLIAKNATTKQLSSELMSLIQYLVYDLGTAIYS